MITDLPKYNLLSRCLDRGWGSGNTTGNAATDSVIWRLVDEKNLNGTYITVVNYNSKYMASYFEKYQMERAKQVIEAYLEKIEECYAELADSDETKKVPKKVKLTLNEDTLNPTYEGISGHQHTPIVRYYLRVSFMVEVD